MAITTKNVYLSSEIQKNFAPSGHTALTTAADIGDTHVKEDVTFTLATSDVGATKSTAFDALIKTTLEAAIDSYVAAVNPGLGIDTTTHTVKYNAEVKSIKRGVNGLANDILLNEATDRFKIICTITVNLS